MDNGGCAFASLMLGCNFVMFGGAFLLWAAWAINSIDKAYIRAGRENPAPGFGGWINSGWLGIFKVPKGAVGVEGEKIRRAGDWCKGSRTTFYRIEHSTGAQVPRTSPPIRALWTIRAEEDEAVLAFHKNIPHDLKAKREAHLWTNPLIYDINPQRIAPQQVEHDYILEWIARHMERDRFSSLEGMEKQTGLKITVEGR